MYVCNSTKQVYRVSQYSYTKGVVIMLRIDKVISPNAILKRTTEGQLSL